MNRRDFAALLLASAAAGCGIFEERKTPLPGERISVLGLGGGLEPDPNLAAVPVTLPPPEPNPAWPAPGGVPTHAVGHPALPERLGRAWITRIGEGASRYTRVLSPPLVAGGRVFAMDGATRVSALDTASGGRIWAVDLKPENERGNAFGGGPCFWNDRLYVTTGYGEVVALDPADGRIVWRQRVAAPLHAPPTVTDGRIFALNIENVLDVLSAEDGRRLWSHHGIPETAGLLGGASPAVSDDIVVVGYSSGEVFGLRPENGRVIWSDSLAAMRAVNAVAGLADIRGRPVIDRGRAYAISHSGRMAAIDLRTGERAWEQPVGSSHGPWVCGDYIFALAGDNQAVCLRRDDGKVHWLRPLPRFRNEQNRSGPIYWAGPVLGGNRLIVLSSAREMMMLSPQTGDILDRQPISGPGYVGPVIAQGSLYMLTDDANLSAYRG